MDYGRVRPACLFEIRLKNPPMKHPFFIDGACPKRWFAWFPPSRFVSRFQLSSISLFLLFLAQKLARLRGLPCRPHTDLCDACTGHPCPRTGRCTPISDRRLPGTDRVDDFALVLTDPSR
jgi:hypothetical protein